MALVVRQSSHSPNDDDDDNIPTGIVAFPTVATAAVSRRLPPPCWSPEETVALIDAYKEKWYSLNRGNLRANHWQEVADEVASRCPVSPSKTAVQCRHKMEKLRKRYRGEIQRATTHGGVRRSTWVHFRNMEEMEKGPISTPSPCSSSGEEEDGRKNSIKRINDLYNRSNVPRDNFSDQGGFINGSGFRFKIPGGVTKAVYSKYNEMDGHGQHANNPNPRFSNRDGFSGRGEKKKRVEENRKQKRMEKGVGEVVAAIQALGEGFMRIEKAKMDMVVQIEEMRMEMELKRTESQQRIMESFVNSMYENSSSKKTRRM